MNKINDLWKFSKVKTSWSLLNASKQMKIAKTIWHISSGMMDSNVLSVIIQAVKYVKIFSRTCNKCSHTETATANTLFHKVKFGIRKAFFLCFEMSTGTKSLSASYMGVRYGVAEKTARLLMHKVRTAIKSSGNHPVNGQVNVDEFVVGGKEKGKVGRSYNSKKKKVVCAVQLTDKGKISRMYAMVIDNYSSKEPEKIFTKHIDKQAGSDNRFMERISSFI